MEIRPARRTDHPDMLRIWLAGSRAAHGFLGEEVLQAQLEQVRDVYLPQADNWVAACPEPVGFIGLIDDHIGGLFVDPAFGRRGVATKLIDHGLARFGALTVEVYERNGNALSFYRRRGFEEIGRKETDDEGRPFALVRMQKRQRTGEGDRQG